jgi:hypothetical protein
VDWILAHGGDHKRGDATAVHDDYCGEESRWGPGLAGLSTTNELSDLLAKRELPKTGSVDELIERLVEADSK